MEQFFDIHSHILPRVDDGSKSSGESIEMLRALYAQGVSDVVMTPHFYPKHNDPENFFEARDASAAHLFREIRRQKEKESGGEFKVPRIYIGAEVAFFNGMNRVEELRDMCTSGTDKLLIEMPFDTWSSSVFVELAEFKKRLGVTPIIAHINRHFGCFKDDMLDNLIDSGVEVQINAEAFLGLMTRHRAMGLLRNGKVHYIGSDCHNMVKRAPNIAEAVEVIRKKHGNNAIEGIIINGRALAKLAKPAFDLENE